MNKKRRATIKYVIDSLEKISDVIQCAIDEEQDSLSNIPDNLQNSERAESMEDAISKLDDAYNDICNVIDVLSNILH